jgi:hypothetical protein
MTFEAYAVKMLHHKLFMFCYNKDILCIIKDVKLRKIKVFFAEAFTWNCFIDDLS